MPRRSMVTVSSAFMSSRRARTRLSVSVALSRTAAADFFALGEATFFGMTAFGAAFAAAGVLAAAFGFAVLVAAAFLGAAAFFTEADFLGGATFDGAFLAPVLDNTEVARGPFLSLYWDAESDAR